MNEREILSAVTEPAVPTDDGRRLSESRDLWPYVIFAAAVAVRLAYLVEMRGHLLFTGLFLDSEYYDLLARDIAGGDWLGGRQAFYNSPFYAYFLAVIYKSVGHSITAVRLVQIALAGGTWVFTYLFSREYLGRRFGAVAALLGCFYDYSVFLDNEILKNSLGMFTFAGTCYFLIRALQKRSPGSYLAGGAFFGLMLTNLPNVLIMLPVMLALPFLWRLGRWSPIRAALSFLVVAILCVAPVTLRNYAVSKDLVMVSFNGGPAFYIGNNAEADGTGEGGIIATDKVLLMQEAATYRRVAESSSRTTLSASDVSGFWYRAAVAEIAADIPGFLLRTVRKILLFWNHLHVADNLNFYYFKSLSVVLAFSFVPFWLVSSLALAGVVCGIRKGRAYVFLICVLAGFMMSVVAFYVVGRYRAAAFPLFCFFAAVAARDWLSLFEAGKKTAIAALALLVLVCVALVFIPFRTGTGKEHAQIMLANEYFKRNRFGEAYEEYKTILSGCPMIEEKYYFEYAAVRSGKAADAINFYRGLAESPFVDEQTRQSIRDGIARLTREQRQP